MQQGTTENVILMLMLKLCGYSTVLRHIYYIISNFHFSHIQISGKIITKVDLETDDEDEKQQHHAYMKYHEQTNISLTTIISLVSYD